MSVCVCVRFGGEGLQLCLCARHVARQVEETEKIQPRNCLLITSEAYRHASPHTSPCLKIQILNQLPHMNKQHEIQQQTSSPVIQKQKENLLFSTVKVALD